MEFKKGQQVPSFAFLQDDGSTSSGDWVYCGSYTDAGNMSARRGKADPTGLGLFPQWAWSWPVNRRIIYNGASVHPETGKPWNPARAVIKWDGTKWTGDVPDGVGDPGSGRGPFIMKPDGVASLYGPGLVDGPFPEHYEPMECPVEKNLMSPQFNNPVVKRWEKKGVGTDTDVDSIASCDPRFPFICSTYRVTEHWQTGLQTRWVPWLAEMQPGMFVEMSEELAKDRGFTNGELVTVKTSRGELDAVAIVTPRMKPFNIDGNTVHMVGIPWHYGWATTAARNYNANDKKPEVFTTGDAANLLTPYAGDPNTMIPESKAFMANVVKKGVK
jgi:formate dehydrogenase major subunit